MLETMENFSEHLQDKYLDEEIFKGKENGVFIEVGACDGIYISNTYFFEKYKNWTGICIEPRENAFNKLKENRDCICENVCISTNKKELFTEFFGGYLNLLSGIKRFFCDEHKKAIEEGLRLGYHKQKTYEMPAVTLTEIINKHNFKNIDLCCIDTEGSELEILKTIDFDNINIKVFVIENNYNNNQVELFLKEKGYNKIKTLGTEENSFDDIYIKS